MTLRKISWNVIGPRWIDYTDYFLLYLSNVNTNVYTEIWDAEN